MARYASASDRQSCSTDEATAEIRVRRAENRYSATPCMGEGTPAHKLFPTLQLLAMVDAGQVVKKLVDSVRVASRECGSAVTVP